MLEFRGSIYASLTTQLLFFKSAFYLWTSTCIMACSSKKELSVWRKEEMEDLIALYEGEHDLWDIGSPNYSKKDCRQRALDRISDGMKGKFTVSEINQKLQHLRSYYARELAKKNKSSKSGASTDDLYKSKWIYFDSLDTFLRPQITPRKSVSNLDCSSVDNDDDSINETCGSEEGKSKKRKTTGPMAVDVLNKIKNRSPPVASVSRATESENEDLVFARYLANEMSKIKSRRIKNDVKIKLQSIIFEAQSNDEVAHNQTQSESTHTQLRNMPPSPNVPVYKQRVPLWNPCVYDAETSGSSSKYF